MTASAAGVDPVDDSMTSTGGRHGGRTAVTMTDRAGEPTGFEAYRVAVSQAFVPLQAEAADEASFTGTVSHRELGPARLAEVTAGAHLVLRSSRLIHRADPECYKLSLQVAGGAVLAQDGREAVLAPGDLVLYDTTRPYELRFSGPYRMLVLMFPRRLLAVPPAQVRLLTGHRLPGGRGLAGVVGPFLEGLQRETRGRLPEVLRSLGDAALDMVAAALVDELGPDAVPAVAPRQAALLQQIKQHVEDRLTDPGLSPTSIAAAHHISPRYLRKVFAGEGDSVTRWIRSRRLERCRRDLVRAELADQPISAVAAHWGFPDPAHFSRLFRSTYGQSPRQYRHAALGIEPRPDPHPGSGHPGYSDA